MEASTQEIYRIVFKEYPDVLDIKQISKMLGISTQTVYKLVREGSLPAFKVGREFRISKIILMNYLQIFGSKFAVHHA